MRLVAALVVALVVALGSALVAAGPAAATTVPTFTTEQLVAKSDVVVRGTVASVHVARWRHRLVTLYTVDVVETWKGAPGARVLVALPGGTQAGVGQVVPGTPRFAVGDDLVLFLADDVGPGGARATIGLWQGAYRVAPPAAEGPAVAAPFTHDVDVPAPPTPLDALRARVRDHQQGAR